MNEHEFLVLIPARRGSKGLLGKNMRLLAGTPLVAHTIEAAKASGISRIIVSTDDPSILRLAGQLDVVALLRPPELAADHSAAEPVIAHTLAHEEQLGNQFKHILYLQPTSPFRQARHIAEAIQVYLKAKANSLISVVETTHTPFKCFVIDGNNRLSGLYDNQTPFMNRQQLPKCYLSNGAIYIINVERFIHKNCFYHEPCIPYVMSPSDSIDIDNQADLDAAESHIKERENAKI